MALDDLSPEIQLQICRFCSLNDLYSLSRVHTSLRGGAESVLYRHISIKDGPCKLIKFDNGYAKSFKENASPLFTLATSSQKAATVRSLHVDLGCIRDYAQRGDLAYDVTAKSFVLINIAEMLKKMPHLTDLRIMSGTCSREVGGKIGQVIRDGCFKLHTLCLDDGHDFEGIVSSQSNLRLLGVYCRLSELLYTVEGIFQHLLPRRKAIGPKLFIIDYSKAEIAMFPSLHHPGEALQACEEAEQLTQSPDDSSSGEGHFTISLAGISEENISLFTELMATTATWMQNGHLHLSYPCLNIIVHHTSIQDPWKFPEFIQSFAFIKNMEELYLCFPDDNAMLYLDLQCDLVIRSRWGTLASPERWNNLVADIKKMLGKDCGS